MRTRRDILKENIADLNLMQYEMAEMAEWMMKKLENGQHISIPIKIDKANKIVDVETMLYALNPKTNVTNIFLATGEEINATMNLDYMQQHLEENFKFRKLDNGLLVNMKMIQWYHSNLHRVYFTKEHSIQVSGAAIRGVLKSEFGKERDLYLNKSVKDVFEYSPLGSR